jgi:uncharacterized protein
MTHSDDINRPNKKTQKFSHLGDKMSTIAAPIPQNQQISGPKLKFIKKTYLHLLCAILSFVALQAIYFETGLAFNIATQLLSVSWAAVLGLFMVVGWLATHIAKTSRNKFSQYFALTLYILLQSIIFVPMLFIASNMAKANIISEAGALTVTGFLALSAYVYITKKDFSFLRSILVWIGILAGLLIFSGIFFGFNLGTYFSIGMVGLAGAAILYDTSNVLHHYKSDQYVSASLQLFASVALMFWYILQIYMSRD